MKINLTKIKYDEDASEETDCFRANVIINGLWAGTVSNDGRGGAHVYFPSTLRTKLRDEAFKMPPRTLQMGGMEVTVQPDEDWLICDILHEKLGG